MPLLGDITDPKKDAAAFQPIADELAAKLIAELRTLLDPAGLTITTVTTVTRK